MEAESGQHVLRPQEQLAVTFFDLPILAARGDEGTIYLAVRDVCAAMNLSLGPQLRRIRQHHILQRGLVRFVISTSGGSQEQDFLLVEYIPTWLLMIQTNRAKPSVRARLEYLQEHIVREVYLAFSRLTGLPATSAQIEDLNELQQIDPALAALAERQARLEDSQDKARAAYAALREELRAIASRVTELEGRAVLSNGQRSTIYHLVRRWAEARVNKDPRLKYQSAIVACWAALHQQFRVTRYEDIARDDYNACVAFIRNAYRATTGVDLPEQQSLDLE